MAVSLARHLASQSVHLTIHPPPRSLSESKRVLAALQKYGEVVTFRNLKYDQTNTHPTASRNTIAVFDSPQAAKSAIASSPFTINIPSSSSSSSSHSSHSSHSFSTSTPTLNPNPSSPSTRLTALTCTLQPSRHNHLSALHRNPCYGSFAVEKDSYQALDLRRTGVPVAELADVPVRWKPVLSWGRARSRSQPTPAGDSGSEGGRGTMTRDRGKGRGRGMGGMSLQEMYGAGFEEQGQERSGSGDRDRDGDGSG